MNWQGTVLVTGAAGNLGRRIVKILQSYQIPVRALVRTSQQSATLRAPGVEIVIGDMTNAESLRNAVDGVTGIISAAGVVRSKGANTPEAVDFQGNSTLIDLAVKANIRHFVLISMIGVQHVRNAAVFAAKYHAEQYLRQSGLSYTVLRSGRFMPTYTEAWERGAKAGRYDVLGRPTTPTHVISPNDIALLAVRALWEPGARARTLAVTSDEVLSSIEIAAIHSRVFGRPIALRRIPTLLLKAVRAPLGVVRPDSADFLGFLQAAGDEPLDGRPAEVKAAYPDFGFESYETFLRKSKEAKWHALVPL